ncbi:hypothetical protein HRbin22_01942 [Candidatus Thermoflexus japonica]|uniref:Uncharacterized protein n=1 Tax=Candidatus Thermoflexus japonica TaxID=2035417 RepID=A0A2H5Y8A2_9CHLR|nr:hypothetical protein HRbin22_01942 [Candidatus Thermoflexus japonica]
MGHEGHVGGLVHLQMAEPGWEPLIQAEADQQIQTPTVNLIRHSHLGFPYLHEQMKSAGHQSLRIVEVMGELGQHPQGLGELPLKSLLRV